MDSGPSSETVVRSNSMSLKLNLKIKIILTCILISHVSVSQLDKLNGGKLARQVI